MKIGERVAELRASQAKLPAEIKLNTIVLNAINTYINPLSQKQTLFLGLKTNLITGLQSLEQPITRESIKELVQKLIISQNETGEYGIPIDNLDTIIEALASEIYKEMLLMEEQTEA